MIELRSPFCYILPTDDGSTSIIESSLSLMPCRDTSTEMTHRSMTVEASEEDWIEESLDMLML